MNFIEALEQHDHGRLCTFAKADRHCHSIFGASLQSICSWAGRTITPAPHKMADLDGMGSYSHRHLYPLINNRLGFEFTAEQTIVEAIRDGVRILEMSLDVHFSRLYDTGLSGFISFVQMLLDKHREEVDFRAEIGLSRSRDPRSEVPIAFECVDSGLFRSIDLYGNEHAQEPHVYSSLYRHADSKGMKLKAHVGEFGKPALIERTMADLELHELQHGVLASGSVTLMKALRDHGTRLNICPSSNVALSVTDSLKTHPIRILVDNGVRVSINTDDKTIFGKTVSEEYLGLYQAGTLSSRELEQLRQDSLAE